MHAHAMFRNLASTVVATFALIGYFAASPVRPRPNAFK